MKYRAIRHPCNYLSELKVGKTRAKVMLRDVTPAGARVECGRCDLQTGETITLWIMEKPLIATVRWTRGEMIGVKFTRGLYEKELSILRHMKAWNKPGQPAKRQVHAFAEL